MARLRSLLTTVEIDVVQRAHDCQGNAKHRLTKGELRLAVRKERSWDYYCLDCGKRMLERDATKIALLLQAISSGAEVMPASESD